jgi:aminoglycoside 6'-N-acetyltransferase I
MIAILAATPTDLDAWSRMRHALWSDESLDALHDEAARFFAGGVRHLEAVLFAHADDGALLGFAELNIRPYAEGCETARVAFLEGWYVDPAHRGHGVGAALIRAAEQWAVDSGCSEFASDALADNADGIAAHLAVGFESVETIRCFRKNLPRDSSG